MHACEGSCRCGCVDVQLTRGLIPFFFLSTYGTSWLPANDTHHCGVGLKRRSGHVDAGVPLPSALFPLFAFWGGGGRPLRERGNNTSRSTGRSSRQNAANRHSMQREERVTVQGPVKKQQPDGMSHKGGHLCLGMPPQPPPPAPFMPNPMGGCLSTQTSTWARKYQPAYSLSLYGTHTESPPPDSPTYANKKHLFQEWIDDSDPDELSPRFRLDFIFFSGATLVYIQHAINEDRLVFDSPLWASRLTSQVLGFRLN